MARPKKYGAKKEEPTMSEQVQVPDQPSGIDTRGTRTVFVGCLHPGNIIYRVKIGNTVVRLELNGSNNSTLFDLRLKNARRQMLMRGEYGITEVPADLFAALHAQYKETAMFKNEMIICADSRADLEAMAREYGQSKSHGLDPVDPEKTATKPADKNDR